LKSRRWLIVVTALVLVVVGVGAAGWIWWLPGYRPALRAGESYGIDVSSLQGSIDWSAVAADGVSFAYIKATEGGNFIDPNFARNWADAKRAGIRPGAYHFFTLCTPGAVQAENLLAQLGDHSDALAPAVDLELKGNCRTRPSRDAVLRELVEFVHAVEARTDQPCVLYVGAEFERRYGIGRALDRPRWRRHLFRRPGGVWTIWQVHGRAHVRGIHTSVDLDVGRTLR